MLNRFLKVWLLLGWLPFTFLWTELGKKTGPLSTSQASYIEDFLGGFTVHIIVVAVLNYIINNKITIWYKDYTKQSDIPSVIEGQNCTLDETKELSCKAPETKNNGITRGLYWAIKILIIVPYIYFLSYIYDPSIIMHNLLTCFVIFLLCVLQFFRLKNIGMSRWWALAMFIPIVNIYPNIACLAYQTDYAQIRVKDKAAKIVIWSFVTILFLTTLAMLIPAVHMFFNAA